MGEAADNPRNGIVKRLFANLLRFHVQIVDRSFENLQTLVVGDGSLVQQPAAFDVAQLVLVAVQYQEGHSHLLELVVDFLQQDKESDT